MAVKLGFQTNAPVGGVDNPHLSNSVYNLTSLWWPASQSIAGNHLNSAIIRNERIRTTRQLAGFIPTSYSDDYYHRIHIIPNSVDLGNVVSAQEFTLYVWNAYFFSNDLLAINKLDNSIIIEGQQAPYTIKALEELVYKITVTTDGGAVIDDVIVWDFGSNGKPGIAITGNRIVAFSFSPNWDDDGVTERLEWSTDILSSESGVEQRSAIYTAPRRYFSADFIFHKKERQLFNNMSSWSAQVWAIPLWHNIQLLKTKLNTGDTSITCATENMEFIEGGLVMLWRNALTYEIAQIEKVNADSLTLKRSLISDWTRGTRIYAARSARLTQQPELARKTDNLQTATIEFLVDEVNEHQVIPPTVTYLGYPVFELRPDESEDLTSQYQRLLLTLDNGQALPLITDSSGFSFILQSYRWLGMGRNQLAAFRGLLHYLNGRQKALWVSSHADDLTIIEFISATEAVITIDSCGYTRFAKNDTDKQHIAIYLRNGTIFYRKIVDSEIRDDTERLALDKPLGLDIAPKQIARVSFIRLCRSNNDTVELQHVTDSEGLTQSNLVFKKVRDNEL